MTDITPREQDLMRQLAEARAELAALKAQKPIDVELRVGSRGSWRKPDGGFQRADELMRNNPGIYQRRNLYLAAGAQPGQKDAEYYHWLRKNAYVGIAPYPKPHEVWCLRLPHRIGANLDADIDEAREGEAA